MERGDKRQRKSSQKLRTVNPEPTANLGRDGSARTSVATASGLGKSAARLVGKGCRRNALDPKKTERLPAQPGAGRGRWGGWGVVKREARPAPHKAPTLGKGFWQVLQPLRAHRNVQCGAPRPVALTPQRRRPRPREDPGPTSDPPGETLPGPGAEAAQLGEGPGSQSSSSSNHCTAWPWPWP